MLPRLRGRPGHGRLGAVRRDLRRPDTRSRWRTSTCSRERQTADTRRPRRRQARRVNLLNWDGKGAPEGLFPPRRDASAEAGRRRASDRRREPADAAADRPGDRSWRARQAAVAAARLPRRASCVAPLPLLRARRSTRCRRRVGRPAAAASSTTSRARRRPSSPPTTSRRSTCAAAAACYLTYYAYGDTRKRGMALLRFKQAYRRGRARARRRRAARPPARGAGVRRHRSTPRRLAAAAASTAPGSSCCGSRCDRARLAVRGGASRRCRPTLPPLQPARSRGRRPAGAGPGRRPRRSASSRSPRRSTCGARR